MHSDIRIELVRLKRADLLAAAEASRLAAAVGRPKNTLRFRLAQLTQRTVLRRRVRPETPVHAT